MIRFLSVLTKSGPMGEWRRAKTEVSPRSEPVALHFVNRLAKNRHSVMLLFFRISHHETSKSVRRRFPTWRWTSDRKALMDQREYFTFHQLFACKLHLKAAGHTELQKHLFDAFSDTFHFLKVNMFYDWEASSRSFQTAWNWTFKSKAKLFVLYANAARESQLWPNHETSHHVGILSNVVFLLKSWRSSFTWWHKLL